MPDRIIEIIESRDQQRRVNIVQRPDGRYSYRCQFAEDPSWVVSRSHGREMPYAAEAGWECPGPYGGLHDGSGTARQEAFCNVDWLVGTVEPR